MEFISIINKYILPVISFFIAIAIIFFEKKKRKFSFITSLITIAVSLISFVLLSLESISSKDGADLIIYLANGVFAIINILLTFLYIRRYGKIAINYDALINSLSLTFWNVYILVDKHEKIREISNSLLEELGLSKKEVIGKKMMSVFNSCVRFTKINDIDVTNAEVIQYYQNPSKLFEGRKEYRKEIYFQNHIGQTIILDVVEKGLFSTNSYSGRLMIGQKKTDEALTRVESDLKNTSNSLSNVQQKFIATLELTKENVFFLDLNSKMYWGNDNWVKALCFNNNTLRFDDYTAYIKESDKSFYISKINSLTLENSSYEIKYRIDVNGKTTLLCEKGKLVGSSNDKNIVGTIEISSNGEFSKTGVDIVDSCASSQDLKTDLESLFKSNKVFELVCINLTSLPSINDKHGRSIGNVMIYEYLKRMKENFLTDYPKIYRTSGLVFYFTLTDVRKMELLKKCLESNDKSMDLTMSVGSEKIVLNVNLGIAESFADGLNAQELLSSCNKSINVALSDKYSASFAYYKDIKNFF